MRSIEMVARIETDENVAVPDALRRAKFETRPGDVPCAESNAQRAHKVHDDHLVSTKGGR